MKRRTLKSRLLAFLLVLCMVVGLTPVYAVSEGEIVQTYELHSSMADDQGMVHVEFTPEEDGHYFLVICPEFDAFMSCGHGAEPVDSFGFDDDYGWGSVYELKAGQTYCFVHETREGYLYEAYMKKVTVPETFNIPETLVGYVGSDAWLEIEFEGALATDVTSSDSTVVNAKNLGNAHGQWFDLLKPGTATITVTANNGVVKTCEVTVKEPGQIALDETKVVDLEAGESVAYTFVPAESGNYIVHHANEVGWFDIWLDGNHNGDCELITETRRGRVFYDMVAGESYILEVTCPEWAEKVESVEIVLTKSEETEGFTIRGNTTGLVDSNLGFQLQFTPEFGVSDDITWSVSDESIAEIVLDTNTFCNLYLKAAGTVTLTATSVQDPTKTASVEVTIEEPKYIQVGETVEVNLQPGEAVEYNFSADGKAGQYMFMIPRDVMCSWGWGSPNAYDSFAFSDLEYHYFVFDLPEDGYASFNASLHEGEPAVSTTLTLVEAIEATDVVFPDGDTVEIGVGEQIRVPMELVGGNFVKDLQFYLQEENGVAWIRDWCADFVELYAGETGTTTVVVEANGIYKELTVNVLPYGHDISDENKWVGTAEDWEVITVEYTPEKDGYYFFHHWNAANLIPAEGGAQPLSSFEHNQGGYWGNVYQLQGGKTYTFASKWELIGDYAYFVKEIFMADDFKIPAAINGAVNECHWLQIEADGVVNPTYKSSNEDVVLIGSGGSDGVNIHLIGEGTADIIVTNQNGKEQVCTVTVSGKAPVQEFWGGANFGLAAGGSITYSYTPWESGLYWIRGSEEANIDISLTANGEAVASKFNMNNGKVFELTAETEYMLTVSSDKTVMSYLNAEPVKEATVVDFGSEEIEFYKGDMTGLWFNLADDEGNMAVAEISAKSSDESVLKITSCDNNEVCFEAIKVGTAIITVTTHNGLSDSIKVNVIERPTLELNEVAKQTLKPGEGLQWFFTAEKAGDYEITVTTNGKSVFATRSWDDEDGSTYLRKEFEGPATFTHKHHMEAGELWAYVVYNLEEEATIETSMVLKLTHNHKLTKTDAVAPTYEAAGNVAYYTCSSCGKLFLDAEGKTETTKEAVVLAQLIKVEEDTAVVSPEAVDKAVEEADKADEVVIDVSGAEVAEVELPVAALDTLIEAEKPLTIVTGETTVTLDAAALAAVAEAANGKDVSVRVEQIETETLNKKQQEAVADREVMVTISANILVGDEYVGDFKGGKATVKVPMQLEEGEKAEDYTVFFLDDDGKLTPVETFVKNGDIYFVTEHFSEYVVLKNAEKEVTDPDVPNTGDDSNLFMMTGLLISSLVALAFVAMNGKKYAYVGKWER